MASLYRKRRRYIGSDVTLKRIRHSFIIVFGVGREVTSGFPEGVNNIRGLFDEFPSN